MNSLSLFCATAQREITRNVNHFCTAFAEIWVLLQGSLDQIELCGIFKAKFKTARTHTITAPGTVEELQCSLLTLIYPPALHQPSDCFQHFCMPRRASAYCVVSSVILTGSDCMLRRNHLGFMCLGILWYWEKTSSIDLAGIWQRDFQSASQLLGFSAYPTQIQTPCSAALLMPLNTEKDWIYRRKKNNSKVFLGSQTRKCLSPQRSNTRLWK